MDTTLSDALRAQADSFNEAVNEALANAQTAAETLRSSLKNMLDDQNSSLYATLMTVAQSGGYAWTDDISNEVFSSLQATEASLASSGHICELYVNDLQHNGYYITIGLRNGQTRITVSWASI